MSSELVGNCTKCNANIYCRDGFLDGVVDDSKNLYCHSCFAEQSKDAGNEAHSDRQP